MAPYVGRYLSEEEEFLIQDGYRFTLKEKPDLDSMVVIAKRYRNAKSTISKVAIVLGVLLIPIIIGILFIVLAAGNLNTIDYNNHSKYECIYYNEKNNSLVFRSLNRGIWYEVGIKYIKNIFGTYRDDDVFGVVIDIGDDLDIDLKIGYATVEEKKSCLNKIELIKKGELNN